MRTSVLLRARAQRLEARFPLLAEGREEYRIPKGADPAFRGRDTARHRRRATLAWLVAAGAIAASTAFAQATRAREPSETELAQRFATWVGERVVFTSTCYDDVRKRRLELKGRTGVITVSAIEGLDQRIEIAIDGGEEGVSVQNRLCFGFRSEEATLAKMVGREYWTKGYLEGVVPSPPPLTHLRAVRVTWTHDYHDGPLLVFTDDSGQEIALPVSTPFRDCIDARFCARRGEPWDSSVELFEQNPRTEHSDWKAAIWKLVESGVVADGMDESMVAATCGARLEVIGAVIGEGGAVSTRYRCNGYEFLLGRKVTESRKLN